MNQSNSPSNSNRQLFRGVEDKCSINFLHNKKLSEKMCMRAVNEPIFSKGMMRQVRNACRCFYHDE